MFYLGFDLGGTKMAAGLLDEKGKIVHRVKSKTAVSAKADFVTNGMAELINSLLVEAVVRVEEVKSAGIAVPGVLDRENGRVMMSPNLGFQNFPLVERLKRIFPFPFFLENDVNAGLWGEYTTHLLQYKHVLGVFPGTGVGGGLIINGALHRGASGNAGEVGHITIQMEGPLCGCGEYGHLEALASRTAMSKDSAFLISAGKLPPSLADYGTDFKNLTSKFFAQALKERQPDVMRVIDRSCEILGIGIAGMVNILDPELVVIGGGLVEKLGDYYLKRIEASLKAHAMSFIAKDIRVVAARLGDDAAIAGAALLAKDVE